MARYGLLGEKLGHSYSPQIHRLLGGYRYELFEKRPEEVEDFVLRGNWDGLNVTVPYKKRVLPLCDSLGRGAERAGSVNTLIRKKDGTIFGDNTDVDGFRALLARLDVPVGNRKTVVLGSGGTAAAAVTALKDADAEPVVISRSGEENYGNLRRHADAALLVNTTPVGMYPENLRAPADLEIFPNLQAVIDVIYNPARTALMMQAERLGIPCVGGLPMLVAQARRSAELFLGRAVPEEILSDIEAQVDREQKNIILIGMPGCGKSTVARVLGEKLGRPVFDSDEQIARRTGETPEEIIRKKGEAAFRLIEAECLRELGKLSGAIIATGGGCVTTEENYESLRQNGTVVWLQRDAAHLPREGRPLSEGDLRELYARRRPLYERFADFAVSSQADPEETAEAILNIRDGNIPDVHRAI